MRLVDALGSSGYVAREVIKAEEIVDFTPRENIAERVARRYPGKNLAGAPPRKKDRGLSIPPPAG